MLRICQSTPLFPVLQVRLEGDTTSLRTHSRSLRRGFCQGEGKEQGKHSLKVRLRFPYKGVGNELRFWSRVSMKSRGAMMKQYVTVNRALSKHRHRSKTNDVLLPTF